MNSNQDSKTNPVNNRKGIISYLKRELHKLEKEKTKSRILWTIITSLIGICNIGVVIVAIYALVGISLKNVGADILVPASLVCLITITLFVMGFILALYQNFRLDYKYKKAIDTIQNEYMKFANGSKIYNVKNEEKRMELLKEQIQIDLSNIFSAKKKHNISKIIVKTLVGDKDD